MVLRALKRGKWTALHLWRCFTSHPKDFTKEPSQVRLFGGSFYQAGKTADSLWFHGQSVAATEPLDGLLYILLYTLYNEGITDEQRRSTSWLVAAVNTPWYTLQISTFNELLKATMWHLHGVALNTEETSIVDEFWESEVSILQSAQWDSFPEEIECRWENRWESGPLIKLLDDLGPTIWWITSADTGGWLPMALSKSGGWCDFPCSPWLEMWWQSC